MAWPRRSKPSATSSTRLPSRFDVFLVPSAAAFICRAIAGTASAPHTATALPIDIAVKHSNYWRWDKADRKGEPPTGTIRRPRSSIIFEKHGFIWGGRWFHYDTMHFEYRPELLEPEKKVQCPEEFGVWPAR